MATQRQLIGKKNRIEQSRFGALRQMLVIKDSARKPDVAMRVRDHAAVDEEIEAQSIGGCLSSVQAARSQARATWNSMASAK